MMEENPTKIQPGPRTVNPRRPLILIHDGGGTTFAYFLFGNLSRDVWALHNPKYFSGEGWEGGVKEMAKTYIDLIKGAGLKGKILLGGWSFGGLISVEIARMVAEDPSCPFTVDGIVIIDSPFQLPPDEARPDVDPDFSDFPDLVRKAFDNADKSLQGWQAPAWDGPALGGKEVKVNVAGKSLNVGVGQVAQKSVKEGWKVIDTPKYEHPAGAVGGKTPPPAVFLKATKNVDPAKGSEGICDIDIHRHEPLLGWAGRYPDFIKAEIEIDSHHFDMFDKMDFKKTQTMTDEMNVALSIMDGILKQ